ncbi:MAG: type II secretion system minor pseudopilin GspI [Pseudohongiella sp.]|uniref:type II secretion system minor pseudopilin GspI n=1 Tax=Pseudohongiella sp. TaxID=1979412 RepID=UPI0034A0A748
MRLPPDSQGFTLVEVMVALFVVAVALPALMFQLGTQLSSTEVLRDKSIASWVAQDQLAIHKLQSAGSAAGELQGERQLAGREWPWSLTTEATPVPGMVRQTVSVYPDVTARQRQRDAFVVITAFASESNANEVQ